MIRQNSVVIEKFTKKLQSVACSDNIITFVLYYLFNTICILFNMMKDNLLDDLLNAWEDTYKKGQLTFWIFLSLKDGSKCVEDIKEFVEKMSDGTMSCEEQSLYRNLRKFQNLDIVSYECIKVSKGPDRKYYHLTEIGTELFRRFTERNILLFTKEHIVELLKF